MTALIVLFAVLAAALLGLALMPRWRMRQRVPLLFGMVGAVVAAVAIGQVKDTSGWSDGEVLKVARQAGKSLEQSSHPGTGSSGQDAVTVSDVNDAIDKAYHSDDGPPDLSAEAASPVGGADQSYTVSDKGSHPACLSLTLEKDPHGGVGVPTGGKTTVVPEYKVTSSVTRGAC